VATRKTCLKINTLNKLNIKEKYILRWEKRLVREKESNSQIEKESDRQRAYFQI
jgi:hypothetical protein